MRQHRRPSESGAIRVGLDLVADPRLSQLLEENPAALHEMFNEDEIAYCYRKRRRDEHLAARFAAKEAVLKALGTGLGARMDWTNVEIGHEPGGRPVVHLHGEVLAVARRRSVEQVEISMTHTEGLAAAHALVVEGCGSI